MIRAGSKHWVISDNLVNKVILSKRWGFPGGSVVKNLPTNAGDTGSIPDLGRSPGKGKGNPLQYSCLENPMDRGAWRATVHGIAKSWMQLSKWKNKTFKCWKLPLFFFAHKIILFIFSYFQVFACVLISNHSPTSSHSETYHASITYKLTMDLFFSNAVCIITCTTLFCTQIFC